VAPGEHRVEFLDPVAVMRLAADGNGPAANGGLISTVNRPMCAPSSIATLPGAVWRRINSCVSGS